LKKATASLKEIRQVSEACRFSCQTIEVAVLQSLALQRQGSTDDALATVAEAVALAEPGGWVRPFVESGRPMADLLRQLRERNGAGEFVDQLLVTLPQDEPDTTLGAGSAESPFQPVSESKAPRRGRQAEAQTWDSDTCPEPLMDALTNRELDVLELLAERLYDKEIAAELNVSVWTVKSHVKHIFEKLHVKNRRQAVLRAEELGLLRRK
jgi:LuxR family maltose regulon positive regulatory protein